MSVNWVSIQENNRKPIPLDPQETFLYERSGVHLSLKTGSSYPADHAINISIQSSNGALFLSNRRVVYISEQNAKKTPETFTDFSTQIHRIQDGRLYQPWLGANYYECAVQPVANGGLPSVMAITKFTFNNGGAFEFQTKFSELQERIHAMGGDASQIHHLEDLPVYAVLGQNESSLIPESISRTQENEAPPPMDAPPAYDDAVVAK
ncbi:UPF0664 stress-induced protein [Neolecta irregularis DAH-3]|uniref:UPF0664 stress-induced protein n=1 Tax=Neolecta irregularis (strain DAH-3) TaxID=1198029 RepID=A0A1U7LIF4_NEOID|nr:UPF0664 stress-induced protein [Neolecta irregularis DAH-3]|eukprot:OLL22440.1 UPF0664 stress-induced protein [Neolecta irregularis DAH-3]